MAVNTQNQIWETLQSKDRLLVIAGPCAMESRELVFETAQRLAEYAAKEEIFLVFKSSYDKANRTSLHSFRGPGLEKGLEILQEVKESTGLPVTTDVHHPEEALKAGEVVDVVQVPAFLCRQTDLILAAAQTGKIVNIKKGQFLAPEDVQHILEKAYSTGNSYIAITERGTTFGYHNLVVDFRGIPIMKRFGCPVLFDATHSVQLPGGAGNASGGNREWAPLLAYAAIAVGADGIFFETHPNPNQALSDGPNMIPLAWVETILKRFKELKKLVASWE